MSTAAPLPRLRDLAAALGGAAPDDTRLAAPWRRDSEAAFWFSRGAWALAAVVGWWEAAKGRPGPALWLPDYFCNQASEPARAAGARVRFYPVGSDLAPRWPALRARAAEAAPDLFVLVHTFGHPGDARGARSFCDETGALLIEDAAHVLGPAPGIGEAGEFVLYCPHKTLALPDGAVLLMRDDAGAMGEAVANLGRGSPAPWPWLLKRLVQKGLPGPALRALIRRRTPEFAHDAPYRRLPRTPRPSPLARKLLAGYGAALDAAAADRRSNEDALRRALEDAAGCRPLFPAVPRGVVPYRLVLRCADEARAAARFQELRRRGSAVESWPDLAPEVLADPGRHGDALALRRELLLLPVHAPTRPDVLAG